MDEELLAIIVLAIVYSVFAILACVFSIVAIKKGYKNGVSITGLVLSIISFLFLIVSIMIAFYYNNYYYYY